MKNIFLLFIVLILNSCISRDPVRFCKQTALDSVTYTFTGEWPDGARVRVYYTNYRGIYEDFRAWSPFSFTETFARDHIQRRIRFEMIQEDGEPVNGVVTVYEEAIILAEIQVVDGYAEALLDICN